MHRVEPEMVEISDSAVAEGGVRTFEAGNGERWVLIRATYFVYLLALARQVEDGLELVEEAGD